MTNQRTCFVCCNDPCSCKTEQRSSKVTNQDLASKWAGAVGLLCQCSVKLGNGVESDELRELIEQAAQEWCNSTDGRWRVIRTIHRIEVEPT